MRLVIGLLAVSIVTLSQALAGEPEQPATSQQPTQSSSPPQAAATPVGLQTAAKASIAPATGVTRELIKQAHDLGYKIEHRGEEV